MESILNDLDKEDSREITQSPPRKKTKLSELSKLKKVVGFGENKNVKVSKYFQSKKNLESGSVENVVKPELAGDQVRGRRLNVGEVGTWFQKIEKPTTAQGKFIYSTEQEPRAEETQGVLREISNSLEDTPELLSRQQRRNPFAVKLQSKRLSEDLAATQELEETGGQEGSQEGNQEGSQEVPVIPSSQLSLYSIDGDSLTFSQSPCSTQPLAGNSPEVEEEEPLTSQNSQPSPPQSRSQTRPQQELGLPEFLNHHSGVESGGVSEENSECGAQTFVI